MNLFDNDCYGYEFVDQSRHFVLKHLEDEKTLAAIKDNFFKAKPYISSLLS